MDIYLRGVEAGYLALGSSPVTATSEQPQPDSLLAIANFDPLTRNVAADPVIRSHNQVILRTPAGVLLAPTDHGGVLQLAPTPQVTGPRIGFEVLRIVKVEGQKGEPIQPGDRVVFRFVPAGDNPVPTWMSAAGGVVSFRSDLEFPGPAEFFQLLLPLDLADLLLDYDDLANELAGQVILNAPALPGGHIVHMESPDAPDLFQPADLLADEQRTSFGIELAEPFARITPCQPRTLTLRATLLATGTALEEQVILEGDRAHFLMMKVEAARRATSPLPMVKSKNFEVEAVLRLDPDDRRMARLPLPLPVTLSADSPLIMNLVQQGRAVDHDTPIRFTFSVQQPAEEAPVTCGVIRASFPLGGRQRQAQFAVKISHKGILLDPR